MKNVGKFIGILAVWFAAHVLHEVFGFNGGYLFASVVTVGLAWV